MTTSRTTFADTISGYITGFNRTEKSFGIKTSDGREFQAFLTPTTFARIEHNLEESYIDATGRMANLLTAQQYAHVYGVFYSEGSGRRFEAKSIVFAGDEPGKYRHEESDWWVKQIRSIGNSYMHWQFNYPQQEIDYRNYRTILHLAGGKRVISFKRLTLSRAWYTVLLQPIC